MWLGFKYMYLQGMGKIPHLPKTTVLDFIDFFGGQLVRLALLVAKLIAQYRYICVL